MTGYGFEAFSAEKSTGADDGGGVEGEAGVTGALANFAAMSLAFSETAGGGSVGEVDSDEEESVVGVDMTRKTRYIKTPRRYQVG